ncbi:hypothetical protein [Alkalihalobacillus sp. 1P02AB]|uniref:hypothetical protein n=1 Tax=Alkalihalobacillus sp. 1P02AB TaxID=3132260 RepID=UPI0039A4148A
MYKGKAFCEANLYFYKHSRYDKSEINKRIDHLLSYQTNTVQISNVQLIKEEFDEKEKQFYIQLSVHAEVLVPYDQRITHLNDYRINACRDLRKHFPKAGAIMAHSIDTYTPLRWKGFKGEKAKQ